MGSLDRSAASSLQDHVGQRETREVLSHVVAHVGPDAEQHALALVVAGAVLVGFAEVARDDWSVHGGDDLGEGDLFGRTSEHVATPDTAFGANQTDALQAQQDLLEVGLGESRSIREVADRGRN